jgi:malate synthase
LYEDWRDEEIEKIKQLVGSLQYQQGQFVQAISLFNRHVVTDAFEEFLTLPAYDILLSNIEKYEQQQQPGNTGKLRRKPAAIK